MYRFKIYYLLVWVFIINKTAEFICRHSAGECLMNGVFLFLPIIIYEDVVIEIYRKICILLGLLILLFIFIFGYLIPLILACFAAPKSVTWRLYPWYLLKTWARTTYKFFVQAFRFSRLLAAALVLIAAYIITFIAMFILTAGIILVITACVGGVIEIIWYALECVCIYFFGPFPTETITHKLCWYIVHRKYPFNVDLFALLDGVWAYVKFAVLPSWGYVPYFPWFIKLWLVTTFLLTPLLLYLSESYQGIVNVILTVFLGIAQFVLALIYIDRKIKALIRKCILLVEEWRDKKRGPKLLTK